MQNILTSLRLIVLTMLVCCVGYTGLILLVGQAVFPANANASLVRIDGQVVGSARVAQSFSSPAYFWPRPSAVDYDASAAGGSNLSPANPEIRERAEAIIAELGGTPENPVPAELVLASGAGLDPNITVEAAEFQAPRVAEARAMEVETVRGLIQEAIDPGPLPALGAPLVNVLRLNMLLDDAMAQSDAAGQR